MAFYGKNMNYYLTFAVDAKGGLDFHLYLLLMVR